MPDFARWLNLIKLICGAGRDNLADSTFFWKALKTDVSKVINDDLAYYLFWLFWITASELAILKNPTTCCGKLGIDRQRWTVSQVWLTSGNSRGQHFITAH